MDLTSTAFLAPIFTGGAAIIVGAVTRWTQLGVARERVRWEARLENARFHAERFEAAQGHLIDSVEAANRYLAAIGSIDIGSFEEREPYLFPLLDAAGRARAEIEALPTFDGSQQVLSALDALDRLIAGPASPARAFELWDEVGISAAVTSLSRARTAVMLAVINDATSTGRFRRPR